MSASFATIGVVACPVEKIPGARAFGATGEPLLAAGEENTPRAGAGPIPARDTLTGEMKEAKKQRSTAPPTETASNSLLTDTGVAPENFNTRLMMRGRKRI